MPAPASVPLSFERPTPASRARAKAQVLLDDVRTKALRNAQNAGLLPLLRRAEATLKARQLAMAVHGGEPMTPTIADALLGQVREAMIALQPGMVDMLGRLAETNARLGARSTVEMLALFEGSPKGALRPIAVLEAVAAGSTVLERHASSVARYGQHVIGRFRDVVQEGILLGDTFDEMTRRIQKTGGAVLPTRGWAERIVRTEGMAALNAGAHLEMVEQHATAFPDLEKKLIETFDARTADDSYPAHGQVRPLNGFFRDGKGREYLYPPGRPNDRGVTIPWRRAWLEPDQGDAAETTATTVEPPQPPVTTPVEPTPAAVPPPRPVPVPVPPVPAVEAPGPRSLTPSGFLPAFRNAALRAGTSGELDEVRGVVKGLLRGQGMASSDDARALRGAGRFRLASESEETRLLSGADAIHDWTGEVVMKRSSWLAAKHAAQELKGLSGDALTAAMRGMSSTRRHNLSVLIHEELHGHSPILPRAYRGHGVGLEEAITETLARSTMRKLGGMAPDEATRGFATPRYDHAKGRFVHAATNSYDHYLDDLHGAAFKVAGGSPDALPALLERAMVKTRSGAYRGLATPEAHFEALADAMGKSGRGAELHAEFDRLQRARAAEAASATRAPRAAKTTADDKTAPKRPKGQAEPYDRPEQFFADLKVAVEAERWDDVRVAVRRAVAQTGLISSDVAHKLEEANVMAVMPQDRMGWAAAFHYPNTGRVEIGERMASDLRAFARAIPADGNVASISYKVLKMEWEDSIRILLHEEIHGHGGAFAEASKRLGLAIEEGTTELLARSINRNLWGIRKGAEVGPLSVHFLPNESHENFGPAEKHKTYDVYVSSLYKAVRAMGNVPADKVAEFTEMAAATYRLKSVKSQAVDADGAVRDMAKACGYKGKDIARFAEEYERGIMEMMRHVDDAAKPNDL